jgi:hypothetical protein
MGVNLGGLYVLVAEQRLHKANVRAALQQMRREGMTQYVWRYALFDSGFLPVLLAPELGRSAGWSHGPWMAGPRLRCMHHLCPGRVEHAFSGAKSLLIFARTLSDVLVQHDFTRVIQDTDIQGPGMQIDAAIMTMIFGVEFHASFLR